MTSSPTLERLLAVVYAARIAGAEAEALGALGEDARSDAQPPGALLPLASRVALFVLAGRLDEAITLAETGPSHRWSTPADEVMVPAVLVAASDASRHQSFDALVLASMLRRLDDRIGLARPHRPVDHR